MCREEVPLGDGRSKASQFSRTDKDRTIPICLVRQSEDLGKEPHQQIAICRLSLMVCLHHCQCCAMLCVYMHAKGIAIKASKLQH